MFIRRQERLLVLEALERQAKGFRTDEDVYPLRVPREPLRLRDTIERALADPRQAFDPIALRQRTLLRLEWDDGSTWELWVLMLPSGLKLFCDSGEDDPQVLASGGRHASNETDRQFLRLLAESGGERFGIEMSGGAPARVRTPLTDREFLVDLFVELFEVAGLEGSVRAALAQSHGCPPESDDFRVDVERWLSGVLK